MTGKWMTMKSQKTICLGLALGVVMVFSAAHAAPQSGWYMGLRSGTATADVNQNDLDGFLEDAFTEAGAVLDGESSLDDSDTTWSLFGGYRFNEFLAVEAGYTRLGTTQYVAEGTVFVFGSGIPGPIAIADATFGIDAETKGFSAGLVANLPLGASFDLHANLGLLFSDTELSVSARADLGLTQLDRQSSVSGSDQDLFYGAGLGWHLNENWSLNLDYQLYKDVGSGEDTGETDVDAVTLAVVFHF
jgi:opacity protein-like surface antigen